MVAVSAKLSGEGAVPVTVEYEFGESLNELVEKYGEDVVFSRVKAALTIDLQSLIRRGISASKSQEEIQTMVAEWKPGVRSGVRKSPEAKIKDLLESIPEDQRAELLAGLLG